MRKILFTLLVLAALPAHADDNIQFDHYYSSTAAMDEDNVADAVSQSITDQVYRDDALANHDYNGAHSWEQRVQTDGQ